MGTKQAGVELPIGRQPGARASSAEGLGDRSDDSKLAPAIEVAIAVGDLTEVVRLHRLDGPLATYRLNDLAGRDDILHAPAIGRTDVHELDEARDDPRVPEVPGQLDDGVIVDAALDDRVDLDRFQAGRDGVVDRLEH